MNYFVRYDNMYCGNAQMSFVEKQIGKKGMVTEHERNDSLLCGKRKGTS